ncbi:MAG: molybdopterin-dependent oxidoreductase [Propionicimonas sp.]|nr:molybdopterin-dependent oxidoreductase [Propionicimonas sp.]
MRRWRAAVCGLAAVTCGAGLGEAVAVLTGAASPIGAIGDAVIDATPPWAKELAISLFGTADKAVLVVSVCLVMLAIAAGAGIWDARRPPAGRIVVATAALVGVAVVLTRPDAAPLDAVPAVLAGVVSVCLLGPLIQRAAPVDAALSSGATDAAGVSRRSFVAWTAGAGALGVLAGLGALAVRLGGSAAQAVRSAIRLPAPAVTAPPVPPGAALAVEGLGPLITPNADFYRIDTALLVPEVDPSTWSLRIHGLVDHEVALSWQELLALPLEESTTTLMCVSNPVGGELIGNAVWLGYPIRHLLALARPQPGADMVLSTSADGFTASTPLEVLTDDRNAILAVGMNGEPLPPEHGFPVRMVVPGLYGYVSATKWVVDLEVTRFADAKAYWTRNGWSERGPVKLSSRIDVPRAGAALAAGDRVIAGVAWKQHTGVGGVEVQVDGGPWTPAVLATAISADTWVQWSLPWRAERGSHTIRCRATGADGEQQTGEVRPVVPDGATGWDEISVQVG